jgi:hypothetical protein
MDKLPNLHEHEDKHEWWNESKAILKKGITQAKERNPQVDTFDVMLELVDRMKIREVKSCHLDG